MSDRPRGRRTAPWSEQYIDSRVPQAARVYDYLLGGTVNFSADRKAAEAMAAVLPGGMESLRSNARANRRFLGRAVRYLAGEAGIRQFLDIGTGIPNEDNVHAVAQKVARDARVVYVDKDPMVLAHAHVLLKSTKQGSTAYLAGDLRQPETILEQAGETLDLRLPIALMLVAILHLIPDGDDPYGIVTYLIDALPRGSFVAISHLTTEFQPDVVVEGSAILSESTGTEFTPRSAADVARFFDGLEMVDPGLAQVDQWNEGKVGPPPVHEPGSWVNNIYCGIGRKL
jgi:S-adenosyl methyltransferase